MVPQFRVSPAKNSPLRIGILLDEPKLQACFARIVEDIQASNFARVELLVYPVTHLPQPEPPKKSALGNGFARIRDPKLRKRILYDLYSKLDAGMRPANDPTALVDCSRMFAGIESMQVEPIGKKFIQRFPPEAIAQIRAKDLDVILRFGFNILHGEILNSARYGVWSFHHGDNDFYRGGPAHFWELVEGAPLSGVILQVLTEELDAGLVLCKSQFATEHTYSVSQNRYVPYWGSCGMVIRKLNELHQFGWEYVKQQAVPRAPYQGKRKVYRTPGNWDMARWLGPVLMKKALRTPAARERKLPHWRLAIRVGTKPLFETAGTADTSGFHWVPSPKGHFWADPFLIEHNARTWLFFEDYLYAKRRGDIACAEVLADGALSPEVTCLSDDKIHYSYPHVFAVEGALWMTPESSGSNSVDLYRCEEFPARWKRERTLLDGKFVDPSLWQWQGRWWMAVTTAEPDSRAGCLLLFYADSLQGEWRLHPASPISTDIRANRGAGRVIRAGNRLIRPSQSGCPIYGYSFSFHEIVALDEKRYEERLLLSVMPENFKGVVGVHSYACLNDIEVVDGQTFKPLRAL